MSLVSRRRCHTACCVEVHSEGKLFLMKSHKWKNKFIIPGGHVELGETFEQALRREVKEETGMDIYDIKFIILQEFVFGEEFWKKGILYSLILHAKPILLISN